MFGPTQIVTQAVGPYELSIGIDVPQGAPAPLYLTVVPQQAMDGATIALRAAPRGQSFESASAAQLRTIPPQPALYCPAPGRSRGRLGAGGADCRWRAAVV